MLKLLKYEIRGNYKKFLMIYGAFVFIILVLISADGTAKMPMINNPMGIAYGAVFLFSIINFIKELNSSDGYLTFSIPIGKREVLAVKLINYLFKLVTIFISILLINLWCVILNRNTFSALFNELANTKWDLLYYSISRALGGVMLVLTLWLTISVCKVEKLNKIATTVVGVVTFMLTNMIIGILGLFTLKFSWILPVHSFQTNFEYMQIGGYGNLTFEIYKIIVIVILLIFTAGLLENRVEI